MSATLEAIRAQLEASLRDAVRSVGGEPPERLALERPPRVELGDLASPIAFDLAKSLRKAPRVIAGEIAGSIRLPAGVQKVQVEGNGYVNFFLERGAFVHDLFGGLEAAKPREGKVIVEHTNINPNKAAHIGHLRNAVLGDVLVRALRFLGRTVEIQNYLDDTGVQVADVVAALMHLAGVGSEAAVREVIRTAALPGQPPDPKGFAYICWDLYAEIGRTYETRPESRAWRTEVLRAIEEGRNETARIAAAVAEATSSAHLSTMGRIGVVYDLLPRESDILQKNFWARAFERLQRAGAVHLEAAGKNAGCWVLRLSDSEEFAGMEDPDKILVRSNGIVTYTAKDIAYQLWKFGLLGVDFDYERFAPDWNCGAVAESEVPAEVRAHPIWRTSHERNDPGAPAFGAATEVYNVIDVRQSYPQKVVREGLRLLGFPQQADRSAHFAYAFVALSPKAARALVERFGDEYRLSAEDEKKPFVEMSGRKGLGVKADDLIEVLTERAGAEVAQRRSGDETGAEQDARAIAVGALRYFLLKFGRNKVIAFDFDEALNFEGDTGPYLQYSAVRADNIFRKLAERQIPEEPPGPDTIWEDDLWEIILASASSGEVVERAVASLELSTIARHAFGLAQAFNHFYHQHPIVNEENADLRNRRLAAARTFRREISRLLGLLGIPEPRRM